MRIIGFDALNRRNGNPPEKETAPEGEALKKGRFPRGLFKKRDQRKAEIVFRDEFVADSIVIDAKDILSYIRGKALPLLGDDFFYSHVYDRNRKTLAFIAFKSGSWDCGKLPWLAPALLTEGDFYREVGDCFYIVTSKNGLVRVEIDYERRDGYLNIEEVALPENIPATLSVRWSLNRRNRMVHLVLAGLFAVSLLFYLDSSNAYTEMARKTRSAPLPKPEPGARTRHMASVPTLIQNVAAAIDGKGVVEKAEINADTMTFTIQFDKYYDAENFLSKFNSGGNYENGKVIYSAPLFDSK